MGMIELWCNGNTSDFGSEIPSSNLGSSTKLYKWGLGEMAATLRLGRNTERCEGSTPSVPTKI